MKTVSIIIVVLILVLIVTSAYFGLFSKINVRVEEQGGETIVYENMVGDYGKAAGVTDKIYHDLLDNYKIETTKGFGIYYDNPKNTDKDKLRSEIGCVVENTGSSTETLISKLLQKYPIRILPVQNYIVTEFPFKGTVSVLFGIMRVYPAIDKFCKTNNYKDAPIMEIYDVPNKKIIYRKEIIQ
ncbi:hypothetical protein AGMMS50212_05380 [Spirochaetia bacterium]|nr:hypothetical protein AGMMS50212_05380 [Spirochaetia bacterium]